MRYLHNYVWLYIEPGVAPCLEGCRLNARMVLPTVQPLSNAVSLWRNTLMTTSTLSGMRLASASMSSRNDTQEWCLMLQHDALRSLFKTWCTQARSFSITMHLIFPSSHPTLITLSLSRQVEARPQSILPDQDPLRVFLLLLVYRQQRTGISSFLAPTWSNGLCLELTNLGIFNWNTQLKWEEWLSKCHLCCISSCNQFGIPV